MATLSEIRTNVRTTYLKIDPNAKVWDDNTLDYFVNRWYSKVQSDFQYSIPECQTGTTVTTISGVVEYDKPSDLITVTGFFDWTYNLRRITKQATLANRSTQTKPSNYYVYGSKIWLYPTPDSTYTLDLLYNKKLPKLTSTEDSVLGDDMNDLVVLYACYLLFISVEKNEKAQSCLNQYLLAKDSAFGSIMYDDDSISYPVGRSMWRMRDDTL